MMKLLEKSIVVLLVSFVILHCGCTKSSEINPIDPQSGATVPNYYEFTITCKGDVEQILLVDIDLGSRIESFGVIGAGPNGRDGGATVMGAPVAIGKPVYVLWRIDQPSLANKTNRTSIATSGLLSSAHQIKSFELVYYGDRKWKLLAYDGLYSDQNKKEIQPTVD